MKNGFRLLVATGLLLLSPQLAGAPLRQVLPPVELTRGGAISTGRCNTSVKSFCRSFEPQRFTWPFVELTRHLA